MERDKALHPVRFVADSSSASWLAGQEMPGRRLSDLLEEAFDRWRICDPAPVQDLPYQGERAHISLVVPVTTWSVVVWWAKIKGVPVAHVLRGILSTAYKEAAWAAQAN